MNEEIPSSSNNDHFLKKKIIIIGAGIAGLSAAARLRELGYVDVKLLEARNAVGGRIKTMHFDSHFIEMGAQWIHGQKGNNVYDIAEKFDLTHVNPPDYYISISEWGNVLNDSYKENILKTYKVLQKASDAFNSAEACTSNFKGSVSSYLSNVFESYLRQCEDASPNYVAEKACYDWYVKFECENHGCNNLNDVSSKLLLKYKMCENCQIVDLKHGYSAVLNVLTRIIPSEWLILNQKVTTINWNIEPRIKNYEENSAWQSNTPCNQCPIAIHCNNEMIYDADHVIVTIPLGCLKRIAPNLFLPSLPPQKLKAIESLGFGAVDKIYLEYEEPFWEGPVNFNMLWFREDFITMYENSTCKKDIKNTWFKYISRFKYAPGHPKMLCGWIIGDGAVFMESLPEEQVLSECHKLLQKQLDRSDLPYPCRVIRSSWASDPCSFGSYSYNSMACEELGTSHEDLANPIFVKNGSSLYPMILFAGEATHPCFYSTVHGAYETGIREANRIYDYYRCHSPNGMILNVVMDHQPAPYTQQKILREQVPFQSEPKIVVIGAGAAGISCAQRLSLNGFTNILVLEALDRIGGRIYTKKFGESVLELGAQWIHGEDCNPLFKFSSDRGLLDRSGTAYSIEGKGVFCTSMGQILSAPLVEEVIMTLDGIKEQINEPNYDHKKTPLSVITVFQRGFDNYLSMCNDSIEITNKKRGIFEWYMKFEMIDNACDKLEDINTLGYAEWQECPGIYHINFTNGFCSFLAALHCDISTELVKLSTPVKCVHWKKSFSCKHEIAELFTCRISHDYPALIECDNGDLIPADHVIVTSSVGFLKSHLETFFTPQLPSSKAIAFMNVGFGTINKIFLVFEKPFWSKDDLGFQLVWIENHDTFAGCSLHKNHWVHGISGFDIVRKQPNALVGWIGGSHAVEMESVPEEEVGRTCIDVLRQFLNQIDIPYPCRVIRTTWNSNPYIKGAYSNRHQMFYDSGCTVNDLIEPLFCEYSLRSGNTIQWPIVTFAGEATDPGYFSAVHGALQSGWREADRLIKFHRLL